MNHPARVSTTYESVFHVCLCPVVLDLLFTIGGCYDAESDSVHSWPPRHANSNAPSSNHMTSNHVNVNEQPLPSTDSAALLLSPTNE